MKDAEIPSSAASPSIAQAHHRLLWAMQMIERQSAIVARRPAAAPDEQQLANPACKHGCNACYMSCAISPARLKWWEEELARLTGASTIGRA